jgi:hypothetical protein
MTQFQSEPEEWAAIGNSAKAAINEVQNCKSNLFDFSVVAHSAAPGAHMRGRGEPA